MKTRGLLYEEEFGTEFKPEQPILDLLSLKGVFDQSWHNDVCPHLEIALSDDSHTLELWFDHPDFDKRETGGKRYMVCERRLCPWEENEPVMKDFETDEGLAAALRFRSFLLDYYQNKKR